MANPITPPPELRSKWFNEAPKTDLYDYIIEQASQWGADQQLKLDAEQIGKAYQAGANQELEACCEWLEDVDCEDPQETAKHLRAARRPRPPSLKEQALEQLDGIAAVFRMSHGGDIVCDKIRRALEALPDD
jgi:hypothetical protein